MRDRKLSGGQERGDGHAEAPAYKHRIPPDLGRRARGRRRHARKESHEDEEGEDGREAHLFRGRRVQTSNCGCQDDGGEPYGEADGHDQGVALVEDADLVSKVDVGREEGDAFAKDTEQGDGEVAVRGEQPVVEHAVLLALGLVDDQHDRQSHADGKRSRHVGIRPRIRVLGPRKSHAEEHETGRKETVPDPVQPAHLLPKAKLRL